MVTSIGVLVGLGLATLTGWQVLDPALAALVALNILWAGWRLVRESVSGLMDEAVTAEVARRIREVIAANAEGAIEAHDVKTRTAGRVTFIEFHLVVPGDMTVATSHEICDRLEAALTEAVHGRRGADPRGTRGRGQADGRTRRLTALGPTPRVRSASDRHSPSLSRISTAAASNSPIFHNAKLIFAFAKFVDSLGRARLSCWVEAMRYAPRIQRLGGKGGRESR